MQTKNRILSRTAMVAGLTLMLGATLASAAQSQTQGAARHENHGQLSAGDYRFVEKAARGGMEEVQMGELARQKGASQAVRNFGERMVTDHTKANDELKQIVAQKGATLPAHLSRHEHAMMNDLQKATGAEFDKTYARSMARDHKKDVKEFRDAAKDLKDPDLKAFAQKTLPILEEHERMAQQLEASAKTEK